MFYKIIYKIMYKKHLDRGQPVRAMHMIWIKDYDMDMGMAIYYLAKWLNKLRRYNFKYITE